MNREPDRDSETTEPPADEPPGRVEFDARGNSVWRWARGVLDSTSVLLKRLENKDLALEPTQKVPVMGGGGAAARKDVKPAAARGRDDSRAAADWHPARPPKRRDRGGGFDPYNTR